jgi:two-component system, NarL family, nitrate/nitrite sensor histidine kinase NarX
MKLQQRASRLVTEMRASLTSPSEHQSHRLQPDARFGTHLFVILLLLFVALLALLGIAFWPPPAVAQWQLGLSLVSIVLLAVLVLQMQTTLIQPMRQLRSWAVQMCAGDLSARIAVPAPSEFGKLVFHVNRLSDALDRLANDMDDVVTHQTEQLQSRNHSLETLYEVAAALNQPNEFEQMMGAAVTPLLRLVGGEAAVLCLGAGKETHVIDVQGAGDLVAAIAAGDVMAPQLPDDVGVTIEPESPLGWPPHTDAASGHLRVPIKYRQRVLGSIELLAVKSAQAIDADVQKLLSNVGAHLGIALEKHYSDEESHNVSIMRERTALAHELHDSLAQTVATLRIQVEMLRDSVTQNDMRGAAREINRVHAAVDDANAEIRELLATFRAPVDQRGLLPALTDLTDRVRVHANCSVYLQHEGEAPVLTPTMQLQVIRIVGEALANARKYSGATILRVLVRYSAADGLGVLIEDDGSGIGDQILSAHPGEHLGLSIMRERAQRAGGSLTIESEPDDGTRVELRIPPTE